ncbi:unnamed protein product, partial [Brugia timori]|uniref:Uncharacterized protein n=1 Tax=Brugia timori TaxID=42155 RepID=A0A0R3QGW4_9BILA
MNFYPFSPPSQLSINDEDAEFVHRSAKHGHIRPTG